MPNVQSEAAQASTVRAFTAPSLREALATVRKELGPDALILDQTQTGRHFTVRACLELPQEPEAEDRKEEKTEDKTTPRDVFVDLTVPEPSGTDSQDDRADLDAHSTNPSLSHAQAQVMCSRLAFAGTRVRDLRGGIQFTGPSGAGKTTCLIKALTEWVMHNGNQGVLVVSTDDQKIGGTAPLQLACQMLGVELLECGIEQARQEMRRLRQTELVLVDSPASESRAHLPHVALGGWMRPVWVVHAHHSLQALMAQLAAPAAGTSGWLAITHTDLPVAAPALLESLLANRASIAWLGDGPGVADSLVVAQASNLAGVIVPPASVSDRAGEMAQPMATSH